MTRSDHMKIARLLKEELNLSTNNKRTVIHIIQAFDYMLHCDDAPFDERKFQEAIFASDEE